MRTLSIIAIGLLFALSGCASQLRKAPTIARPSPSDPPARREVAVKQFDTMRDHAQFEAARSYWRQGDAAKAENELKLLLARSPENKDAGVLLAEVYLATDRAAAARDFLTPLIEQSPHDARLHHALGLAFEGLSDGVAAKEHFQAAARLAPENAAYAADLANWTTILAR